MSGPDLSAVIGAAVAGGSSCWDNLPGAGLFQSIRAKQIAEEAIAWVEAHYEARLIAPPTGSPDAQAWAASFVSHQRRDPAIAVDEGTMIGWFANAMMAQQDHWRANHPERCSTCGNLLDSPPCCKSPVPGVQGGHTVSGGVNPAVSR